MSTPIQYHPYVPKTSKLNSKKMKVPVTLLVMGNGMIANLFGKIKMADILMTIFGAGIISLAFIGTK